MKARLEDMDWIVGLDTTVLFWIQDHLVGGALSPLMVGLSTLGNLGAVWIVIGLWLICHENYRRAGVAVFIGLGFSLVVGNGLLKHLVMRGRPCLEYSGIFLLIQAPGPNDYSFPSGHTFGSFAAAAALFFGVKRLWGILALLLAGAIGFSRLYLFVHYPSDVLAGCVLGISFGGIAWCWAERLLMMVRARRCHTIGTEAKIR